MGEVRNALALALAALFTEDDFKGFDDFDFFWGFDVCDDFDVFAERLGFVCFFIFFSFFTPSHPLSLVRL